MFDCEQVFRGFGLIPQLNNFYTSRLFGYVNNLIRYFYLNFQYFIEDTTGFDKVALLIAFVSLIFNFYLLKSEKTNGKINFFGLDSDEELPEHP